nr:MAG TPA: hypothetical protein [Caudoviricetes sp.]
MIQKAMPGDPPLGGAQCTALFFYDYFCIFLLIKIYVVINGVIFCVINCVDLWIFDF